MTPERWHQLTEIFHAARVLDAASRKTFVADACRDDPTLQREVDAMLAGLDHAGQFGETPLFATSPEPSPPAVRHLAPGSQLGPYQILSPLGSGGMGQVYKAFDPRFPREIAIKMAAERFSERFAREVRAIATLNHPNVCTIHDVGANYLVMELVDGETLRDWLTHALPIERNLEIARQVLEALRAAHHADIVHRDLKPENVMVRADGYVKVLDFGLAARMSASRLLQATNVATTASTLFALEPGDVDDWRLSRPGQILGTIPYMSPEQIQGREVDQRSDLFAFGIILHEMLTGRHPWPRPSPVETLHAILHEDPPAIQAASLMHAELAAIVRKLLRKSPAERYQVADAVLDALGTRSASKGSPATVAAGLTPLTSIAVLPFTFLSGVEEGNGLSLGFADALITVLGRLDDLTVLPTSAILTYPAGADPARACRDLGTRHLLQGNVQKLGSRWRVSIHIFDAMMQKNISSEQHDFALDDVFEVQDQIGRQVVESLRKRFPSAVPKSRDRYSSDLDAYNEFMAGLRESYSDRQDTLESAIQHLSTAVERDPDFALAHAWLSYVLTSVHFTFDPRPARLEKAEHHCRRALMLDPGLPEAHLARASILWSPAKGFQHAEALEALGQVIAVQPNLEQAHNRIASICIHIGRLPEARVAHERAQRSNPNTRSANLEFLFLLSGDYARAEELGEAYLRERPGAKYAHCFHAQPPLMIGDLDLAEKRLATALEHFPDEPLIISLQGMLHARRNQTDLALECVRRSLDSPRSFGHTHHTYYQIACVYAVLGDTDKAMAWLERSVDTGNACWAFFKIDPHLESLREKAEFIRLVADLEYKYTALKIQNL
jgi:serine/threonine protein kinase